MDHQLKQLQDWISESRHIVFFGGAGLSSESGIPDFRSVDGLYHQQYAFPPETILSHSFFERNPEEFYRFYRSKMLFPQARPNAAHWKLAELEAAGLIRYYRGNRLALINKSATPYDREAGLVINASLGEVLGAIRV